MQVSTQPQRILITGSSGFYGRAVISAIRHAWPSADILGLDLVPPKSDPPNRFEKCDITDLGLRAHVIQMSIAERPVFSDFKARHHQEEWLDLLEAIDDAFSDVELHLVCNNYATHRHERVRKGLSRRPRTHIHAND